MKWSARGAAALACVLVAGSSADDNEHRVYRAHETIRFERHCADAVQHQVQGWAHIESEDGRAQALVLAYDSRRMASTRCAGTSSPGGRASRSKSLSSFAGAWPSCASRHRRITGDSSDDE